jgi:excisionase family DNA binding protein
MIEGEDDFEVVEVRDRYGYQPMTDEEVRVVSNLLTPQQAQELLGLSRQRVDQLLRAGTIPCVRIGRVRLVMRRDLARYAEVEGLARLEQARRWVRITSGG